MVILLGTAACGGGDDDGTGPDCSGEVPTYGELAMFDICTMCHSSELVGDERMEAPEDINFDTYEAAVASQLNAIGVVSSGAMPPPGIERPSEEEKRDFLTWAACDTPR
jgi:uncharacterized membrane protein